MKIINDHTAYCTKCRKKTGHRPDQLDEPHYNCGGKLIVIDTSELIDTFEKGSRHTFIGKEGTKKRFTIGVTTGWKPVLLLMHNARAISSCNILKKQDFEGYDWENRAYKINSYIL